MWIAVAQIIPARAGESVHGISDTLGGLAALWTGGLYKLLALSKSISCRQIKIIWKRNRELVKRNWDVTTAITMNHWNWIAPVTLP